LFFFTIVQNTTCCTTNIITIKDSIKLNYSSKLCCVQTHLYFYLGEQESKDGQQVRLKQEHVREFTDNEKV